MSAQIERRVAFRRALKKAMATSMKFGAKGFKISASGRLGGAKMGRFERYHDGQVPLHTLRADIDYGTAITKTTYGVIGIKCWIFKGEVLDDSGRAWPPKPQQRAPSSGGKVDVISKQNEIQKEVQKARIVGVAKGGTDITFGDFRTQAINGGKLTARQIEAARIAMTRHVKRAGKIWIRVFPDKPSSKKPAKPEWVKVRVVLSIGQRL